MISADVSPHSRACFQIMKSSCRLRQYRLLGEIQVCTNSKSGNLSRTVYGNHVSKLIVGRRRLRYIKLLNRKKRSLRVEPVQPLPCAKVSPLKFHHLHCFPVLACSHPKGVCNHFQMTRVWSQDCHCLPREMVSRIGHVIFFFPATASETHGSCRTLTVKRAFSNNFPAKSHDKL